MELLSPHESSSAEGALHQALVDTLQRDGSIQTPPVLAAFRAIPPSTNKSWDKFAPSSFMPTRPFLW